jgi:uncharacterized protein (DUF1919 family)
MKTDFQEQTKSKYYYHPNIKTSYPIIHLEDIEIHCIHDENLEYCLKKFNRRRQRFLGIVKNNNYIIANLWSYGELFTNHDNIKDFVLIYLDQNNDDKNKNIFMGPSKFGISNANYINIDKFNDFELVRDDSHVYKFNDMTFSAETFYDFISDKYVFDKEKQCQ